MSAMTYETFVSNAFELAMEQTIGRGEDPARLAEANHFNDSYITSSLNKVKVGSAYAMEIYNSYIRNSVESMSCEDDDKLSSYVNEVLQAGNANAITDLISDYKQFIEPMIELI